MRNFGYMRYLALGLLSFCLIIAADSIRDFFPDAANILNYVGLVFFLIFLVLAMWAFPTSFSFRIFSEPVKEIAETRAKLTVGFNSEVNRIFLSVFILVFLVYLAAGIFLTYKFPAYAPDLENAVGFTAFFWGGLAILFKILK